MPIGSDQRSETKQGIEGKMLGSDREGLRLGIGLGIIDRRSEAINFGACYIQIADLNLTACFFYKGCMFASTVLNM